MFAVMTINKNHTNYTIFDGSNYIEGDIHAGFLREILSYRLDYIYLWDAPAVFALIDNFADQEKLINYNTLPKDDKGRIARCTVEAISYKDGLGVYYQRKLWLKTKKANSTDRHMRLSSTAFINFSNFFGGQPFDKVCKSFDVHRAIPAKSLYELLTIFSKYIFEQFGIALLDTRGKANFWSMGGISKEIYLTLYKIYYYGPYNELRLQSKPFEYEMRACNLLLPGILYLKDKKRVDTRLYKYDRNSLFPYAEKYCPFLGIPKQITEKEYNKNADNYEYIIRFGHLGLKKRKGMPAIFKAPNNHYSGENKEYIFLEECAFFKGYFDKLMLFYDIIDSSEPTFYRMTATDDKAIQKYVDLLYKKKVDSKKKNPALYSTVKFLINNLHGKFSQLTIQEEFDYVRNENNIINKKVTKLTDTWKKSHFDYLRGAWIYSKSQELMLNDILMLDAYYKLNYDCPFEEGLYYIDTDCIICDVPPEVFEEIFTLSDYELGKYKHECTYFNFQAYAPKTYAGDTVDGFKLTCAGMKKEEIYEYLEKHGVKDKLAFLATYPNLPVTSLKRTETGCEYVTEFRPLGGKINYVEGDYIDTTEFNS